MTLVINFNNSTYTGQIHPVKTVKMKRQKKTAVTVSFRCPEDIYRAAEARTLADDIDFSKLLRRALKRELASASQ